MRRPGPGPTPPDSLSSGEPGDPARRHRARRGQGELLRREIIDAATRLLAELGDEEAVSMRAIADAVGVTPPSIYLHFADKNELLFAVCEDRFAELERRMTAALVGVADPLTQLRRIGQTYIRFGLESPEHYRILFMSRDEPMGTTPEQLTESAALLVVIDTVDRAMQAGQIPEGDPKTVAISVWASVHGLTALLIAKPGWAWPDTEVLIARQLDLCESGYRGVPAGGDA